MDRAARRCSLVAILALGVAEIGAPGSAVAQEAQTIELDTVMVTGDRFGRLLSDTYQSVTVIEATTVEREAMRPLTSLIAETPNAYVQSQSELPTIRGVQGGGAGGLASGLTTGALPRLPVIVDGIARAASVPNGNYDTLWDVERVEVLRGPQTLLRGRNGIAGAVIVDTYAPSFTPEAAYQAGLSVNRINGPQYIANGMVSGPLTDNIAGRLTVEYAGGDDPREIIGGEADFITEYEKLRLRGKLLGEFETTLGGLTIELLGDYQTGQIPQTRSNVLASSVSGRDLEDRVFAFNGPDPGLRYGCLHHRRQSLARYRPRRAPVTSVELCQRSL